MKNLLNVIFVIRLLREIAIKLDIIVLIRVRNLLSAIFVKKGFLLTQSGKPTSTGIKG